jgi:hypothetical protein
MANRLMTFAFAAVTASFLTACASIGGNQGDTADPRSDSASVQVENNNWHDMRVYAVLDGVRTRQVRSAEDRKMPREAFA